MRSKIIAALLPLLITVFIAGCASSGASRTTDRDAVHVDVDLTVLSETVLSAELMNIIVNSDDYIGKTIRVAGTYFYIFYEPTGQIYHYVITKQGDACCQEGLEFIWNGEHVFPDDYPATGTPIELIGVFSRDESESIRFFYLATDDIQTLG